MNNTINNFYSKNYFSTILSSALILLLIIVTIKADNNANLNVNYLAFIPYWGWSNQIMELKTMATMAKNTQRTLVIPKYALGRQYTNSMDSYQLNHNDCHYAGANDDKWEKECDLFEDLIDLEQLQKFVPIIKEEDFLFQNTIKRYDEFPSYEEINFGVDFSNKTLRMSHRIKWVDEHLSYDYKPKKGGDDEDKDEEQEGNGRQQWCYRGIISVRTCLRSIYELRNNEKMLILFPEYHSFGVGRIRSKERGKQYKYDNDVHRFIVPSKRLRDLSIQIINQFPLNYVAVHIRRGDFLTETWAKDHVKDIESYAIELFEDPKIGNKRMIYIATDEVDENMLGPFNVLNVTFLNDFLNSTSNGEKGKFWHLNISIPEKQLSRSYLEQLICIA